MGSFASPGCRSRLGIVNFCRVIPANETILVFFSFTQSRRPAGAVTRFCAAACRQNDFVIPTTGGAARDDTAAERQAGGGALAPRAMDNGPRFSLGLYLSAELWTFCSFFGEKKIFTFFQKKCKVPHSSLALLEPLGGKSHRAREV